MHRIGLMKMGRRRVPGLEWLEPENTEQHQWASGYLEGKGFGWAFVYKDRIQPGEPPSYLEMRNAGIAIEQDPIARELFRDMKDAWRQERNRKKKKDSGHQVCAFTFSTTTKDNLQEMAQKKGTTATALLEKLITRAYKAQQPKPDTKTEEPPEQPSQDDQFRSLEEIHDLLSGKPGPNDEQAIQNPPPEGSLIDAISAPEQITIVDNQEPAIRSGISTPDTHEQIDSPQAETPTDDEFARYADRAKKSISELLTIKAENKAIRAKQARPPSPPEQVGTSAAGAGSPPTTLSDEPEISGR